MKPYLHAQKSAKLFGGKPEDYFEIHNWFDATKAHVPDSRHRLILHNSFGIFLCEQTFGHILKDKKGRVSRAPYIIISTGKKVSVRDIAEQHVLDDLGRIPTLVEVLDKAKIHEAFGGSVRPLVTISSEDLKHFEIVD